MKKILTCICLILTVTTLVSCGIFQGNSGTINPPNNQSPTIPPNVDGSETEVFYALFDETSYVSIKLDISDEELQKIQNDYEYYSSIGSKSPIYRMADLIITIKTKDGKEKTWNILQVGVRMKGNTSRTDFYSEEEGMYNLVHFKISFQETFDKAEYYGDDALEWASAEERDARKNRTFATLEKIDIRWNRNDDSTYIREHYAYELYREFGVLAPHTTLASVDIADDHAGVWMVYEPIDKVFLEKNLPEEALGGDLYKLGWTNEGATFTSFSSYGTEDEDNCEFYIYDLKTNKKTSDHSSLKNLIQSLNSFASDKSTFDNLIDIDNFMYYCAVSYFVGNPDDLRNNYNNTYIYFRKDNGKMMAIPYDSDRGLGVNTWNPTGHGMTEDKPFDRYNIGGKQRSPLFTRTICEGGLYKKEFTQALAAVDASKMLTNKRFNESYEIAKALYSTETKTSRVYYNAEWCSFQFDIEYSASIDKDDNMSFNDYVSLKRVTLYSVIGDLGNKDSTAPGKNPEGEGPYTDSDSSESGKNPFPNVSRDPIEDAVPYIIGDFTNWDIRSKWKMTDNGDGTFSATVSIARESKFKIYDNNHEKWYGYEFLDPDCDVTCDYDKYTNICLAPGSYYINFNTETVMIYIEKN